MCYIGCHSEPRNLVKGPTRVKMGETRPDPLNLCLLEKDYVKEGMSIYVLGFPAEHLRDGKHCSRCFEAPKKLYACAKCQNPARLYCVSNFSYLSAFM